MGVRTSWSLTALVVTAAVALPACVELGHLTGRATDEWTHTYPLAPGGEVRIGNTNGRVEVEGVDGSTVEIRAERIARGVSDEAAREMLEKIEIKEDVKPDRVSVETSRLSGIMIGASLEVRYHVKAPKNALIDAASTNGQVVVTGLTGKVIARTTNGGVDGRELSGGIDAKSTNGAVKIEIASVSSAPITLRTTNGSVTLTLPESAKADLSASCTNGRIQVSGMKLDVTEQSRRRFEGRMNGGGTSIELHTTNGSIRVRSRGSAETET